ncbi:helix-turn-helix domain-containing protein [Paenibacillus ferrarius]|uniref:helix-turn-helix domain-containing protein n=1 Tax=Paenibacillus ferrarius TaxID=1469647 RepID=UPI003D2D05D2
MKRQPVRLTNAQFIAPAASYGLYLQHIDAHYSLHWHEFFELCFVLRGRGCNIVNGTEYTLEQGSMFLLTPADFHEIFSLPGEPMDLYNFVFSTEFLKEDLRSLMFRQVALYMADMKEQFAEIEAEFKLMAQEEKHAEPGYRSMIQGALERILMYLHRAYRKQHQAGDASKEAGALHEAIQRSLVYIHHHFREALRLEDAAREAGLSPNYFSQSFRALTGTPFQTYLQHLRLTFAKSLLAAADFPVTDICYASGFNTLTHFERAFKAKFGRSPRHFRKPLEDA